MRERGRKETGGKEGASEIGRVDIRQGKIVRK
jgi:hypothetical protein